MTKERLKRLFKKIFNGQILIILFPAWSFSFLQKRYQSYVKNLGDKPLVIGFGYGGLGDYLVSSSIPRLVYEKYGVRTEIPLNSQFRSSEIKDFVWGSNPYVSFSDAKGKFFLIPNYEKYQNYNEMLQAMLGVKGDLFDVYYKAKPRPEVSDKIVCELTFGPSGLIDHYDDLKFWDKVVEYLKTVEGELILLRPSVDYSNKGLMNYVQEKLGLKTIPINSIYELTDLICSAKGRIFLDSGPKSIAAAYSKPAIVLNTSTMGRGSRFFRYETNKNIVL